MSKFTPGKWKIDMSSTVSYECPHIFIYPEDLEVKQIDEDVHIALVNANYDECTTNAELIAAAPEMHHLLRCFIAIDDLKSESFTDDNHPLYMRALVEQDAAVKATRALLDCIDGKEEQE